ncbi:hypothetical protein [Dyadobacter chenhuakuii]|uniref:Uncharacterized protein n=1 Tax=Dyadobacter chenhuakuii TaxID=2909339 RepID=A0ABY4XGL9_9BACT|nr:hypothetical protein [Dyadobacter chenhuakuii]MCF2495346.1 hypothetical protein [Dyadobacter chenhuakuii]USJ29385.1 hypothetical protein NFI80_16035 [Dyadobacter chenhuakuii]
MSKKINNVLIERVNHLIELANKSLATKFTTEDSFHWYNWVSHESFYEFQTASQSFILNVYGENSPYLSQFKQSIVNNKYEQVLAGKGIINSIKTEIENGWLGTLKGLMSSEIFSDFLEMSQHLLDENYKDPAAVMIGSVLEEHLRQLSLKHGIPINEM